MISVVHDSENATVDGHPITRHGHSSIYDAVRAAAAAAAARQQEPILLAAEDRNTSPAITFWMLVHPDGHVERQPTPAATAAEAARSWSVPPPSQAPAPVEHQSVSPSALSDTTFVRPVQLTPQTGWRRAVHTVSGGWITPQPSADELRASELLRRVRTRTRKPQRIAVICLKGGIGKTSTTVGVGLTLAEYRGDPVIAVDANPDAGDLAERCVPEPLTYSLPDLLQEVDSITGPTDLARYTGLAGRLTIVPSDQEPSVSESLSAQDYDRLLHLIQRYYAVILTDCGTGVTHPAMRAILGNADSVVIAGGYAVSGARRAARTLTWLSEHGYPHLAARSVVVLTAQQTVSSTVDTGAITAALATLGGTVVNVPHDQVMADGGVVRLGDLQPATRQAYLEIAAAIASGF